MMFREDIEWHLPRLLYFLPCWEIRSSLENSKRIMSCVQFPVVRLNKIFGFSFAKFREDFLELRWLFLFHLLSLCFVKRAYFSPKKHLRNNLVYLSLRQLSPNVFPPDSNISHQSQCL